MQVKVLNQKTTFPSIILIISLICQYVHILLHNVALINPTEEKVSLVFAAATLATVEGSLKLPVVHHSAIYTELQTDPLSNPNIPAEKW